VIHCFLKATDLPILSKIMEKVVFSQLAKCLKENNIIHPICMAPEQVTALLLHWWVEEVEYDKMVGVLMCDQSTAFDLCDHNILVQKLKLIGVEDSSAAWILSYLAVKRRLKLLK
jgi:hypothetical protein